MKKSFLARGILSTAALVAAVLVPGAAHAATQPACGDTITQNTTLTADIGPCTDAVGLRIGANGITLDLGGHRISGVTTGGQLPGVVAIAKTNVTIQNGTVEGFGGGVQLRVGTGYLVQRLVVQDNYGTGDPDSFTGGIITISVRSSTITNNVVRHNGSFAGIQVNFSSGNLITRNSVSDNNLPLRGVSDEVDDAGIRLRGSNSNVVSENAVSRSGTDGIKLEGGSTGNTVQRNSVSGNGFNGQVANQRQGDGIRVSSDGNTVQQNAVVGNAANGILVEGGSNRILGNVARGNNAAHDTGRPAFDLQDTNTDPPCGTNTWTANQADTRNPSCAT